MEEYTQITLNEWQEWREDIRKKLQETAQNFVYIGFRLRQIRDSGILDGCSDIFEFANREYGLGKSTVSRFIAINEKFSEGGYSLEMRKEYQAIGSSKLSEMLTLSEAECQLITEKTTVREIRELKKFTRQQDQEAETVEIGEVECPPWPNYTPLEKCIIDMFSDNKGQQELSVIMKLIQDENWQQAAELINPAGYRTHKKGIIFLFLYDWNTGIKYKLMTLPEPQELSWIGFLGTISKIYGECYKENGEKIWENFYHDKTQEIQENQGLEAPVATSQQGQKEEKNEAFMEESEQIVPTVEIQEEPIQKGGNESDAGRNGRGEKDTDDSEEQIPGQDNIMNHPEYLPLEMQKGQQEETPEGTVLQNTSEDTKNAAPAVIELMEQAESLVYKIYQTFFHWNRKDIRTEEIEQRKEETEKLVCICEQLIGIAEDGWIKAD
ncbi:MAG: hypothetical protein HFI29_05610 [Lachnospiraceae bacterium]|nr:hypothetical protein [Lachnospiraceae bacterium]